MQFKKVTHVIFDMDGLLIESESGYDKIISDIVTGLGKEYTDACKLKILGSPEMDTAKIVVEELDLPISVEDFYVSYKKKQLTEIVHPPLLPGVKELVKHFYKNDIPIAVATSSAEDAMLVKTRDHQDVFKLFHHIVCGSSDSDVKHGKPAPDIYLICASRFDDNPHPSNCLVFEDAPNGVKGATTAGMQVVMIPAPTVPQELRKDATIVLNSMADFKPELFGLPPIE